LSQQSLFDSEPESDRRRIDLPDAELDFYPSAFSTAEADQHFELLRRDTPWRHDQILIHGKRIPLPRLQAWYADADVPLIYSGMRIAPLAITTPLDAIRKRVLDLTGLSFNGVLVTLYRDGNDSVGWHSDDEAEFGPDPVIGSVSFGHARDFILKHRYRADLAPVKCPLTHGSVLLMGPGSQTRWAHQLPKRKRITEARINLTLRNVFVR
jgi:alkylated DNA repair dioxygenase AlkB